MNYHECLEYLEQVQILGIKFGLDNVRTVLSQFNDPHLKYSSVLVGGTNGKGSVCAMLARILTLSGYQTGLYTSPHLIHVKERIRIGEEDISQKDFCLCVSYLREKITELITSGRLSSHPTYFETLTCLAFLYYQKKNIDIAVLEVGMGGRFDATNVVTPLLSVITTISPEHQEFLGSTIEEISYEKAGIIKIGKPVISGVEIENARNIIQERASSLKSDVKEVFSPPHTFSAKKTPDRYTFEFHTDKDKYVYSPSLPGLHQGKNAAMAITVSEELSRIWRPIKKETMIQGIESTLWEGRLEKISQSPLIVLDGAHNIEGAEALKKYIEDFLPSPLTLVFAAKRDKKIIEIAEILFPCAEKIILTRFPFRKAAHPEELLKIIPVVWYDRISIEPDPMRAFAMSIKESANKDHEGCVLIAGSLFLVGEAKKFLKGVNREKQL